MFGSGSVPRVNAGLWRAFLAVVAAVLLTFVHRPSSAQPSASTRSKAAEHYDRGVEHFERARYAAAAREFLAADELVPSSDSLSSAIAAGRRSNDHLLVVRASQRAIARESVDPKLAAGARQALAEASRHLARIEATCDPSPCTLELDGAPIAAGTSYALPGTHTIVAKAEGHDRGEQQLSMAAGASYRVALTLESSTAAPATPPAAPSGTAAPEAPPAVATEGAATTPEPAARERPLPPVVFYAGAGVTALLAGITTWSGLNTLSARDDLPERPTHEEIDDVEARITRTDVLLAATVLVGAASAYAGIALVNWKQGGSAGIGVAPATGGLHARISGQF